MPGANFKRTHASWLGWLWQLFAFTWVNQVIDKASKGHSLSQEDADKIMPDEDNTAVLVQRFEKVYQHVKSRDRKPHGLIETIRQARHGYVHSSSFFNTTARTLLSIYKWDLLVQPIWVLGEMGVRLASPLLLREFLRWLRSYVAGADPPVWKAWSLAVGIGSTGFVMAFVHHRLFWMTFHLGFQMRQQCVGAVQSKVLRLNTAAVTHASEGYGHVVSLISSDVRRFDDIMVFWNFLWAGPLELILVLVLVSLELGVIPALAGISAMLAVIPIQAAMVRPVSRIRSASAQVSDERVRLTGELIEGALAMKMLSWELPFTRVLSKLRAQEAVHIQQMARIRAINSAMMFAITPVVSFITFACVRAFNGELNLASVFYSLALLHLPKSYMVQAFVQGVQAATELHVSLKRIDTFLSVQEPGAAAATTAQPGATAGTTAEPGTTAHMQGQPAFHSKDESTVEKHGQVTNRRQPLSAGSNEKSAAASSTENSVAVNSTEQAPAASKAGMSVAARSTNEKVAGVEVLPPGTVALRGADYDWLRPLGDVHQHHHSAHSDPKKDIKASTPHSSSVKGVEASKHGVSGKHEGNQGQAGGKHDGNKLKAAGQQLTLHGVRVEVQPGELLGVCGDVGSGKSSVLAAMLGELQPLLDGVTDAGPLLVGNIAYCAQVPWIMSGSVRDNIVFWHPYDALRYSMVLKACALDHDIAMLPAGHDTELGERGINLSGGQKARVALARAAYAGADVVLLDDPLSAVDPRVGRILFNHCIGPSGVMQGATRVLVTHQRQFLPLCDRVMVLRGGNVVALGTWTELSDLNLPELQISTAEDISVDEWTSPHAVESIYTPPGNTVLGSTQGGASPSALTSEQHNSSLPGRISTQSESGQDTGLRTLSTRLTRANSSSNQLSTWGMSATASVAGSSITASSAPPSPSARQWANNALYAPGGAATPEGARQEWAGGSLDVQGTVAPEESEGRGAKQHVHGSPTTTVIINVLADSGHLSQADNGTTAAIRSGKPLPKVQLPDDATAPYPTHAPTPSPSPRSNTVTPSPTQSPNFSPPPTTVAVASYPTQSPTSSPPPMTDVTDAGPWSGSKGMVTTLSRRQSSLMRRALSGMFSQQSRMQRNKSFGAQQQVQLQVTSVNQGLESGQPNSLAVSPSARFPEEHKHPGNTKKVPPYKGRTHTKEAEDIPRSYKDRPSRQRKQWCGFYKYLTCGRFPEAPPGEEPEDTNGGSEDDEQDEIGRLVQAEEKQQGSVSKRVYLQFMSKMGPWLSAVTLVLMVSGQAVFLASDWWIALWASSGPDSQNKKWLIGYGLFALAVVSLSLSRAMLFFWSAVEAATRVHDAMVQSVFRAPLAFFHTNPAGRILNRFSSDQTMIDDMLPFTMFDVLQLGFMVLSALVMVAIAVPVILPVFLPALMAFVWINRRYLAASRQVKRWEATTRSPVFASMTATLKGLPTVRAYGVQQHFHTTFLEAVTINGSWWRVFLGISRWVGLRVDVLSSFILLASALLAVAYRASVKPNLLALGLMNVLQLTVFVQWCIRQVAETENIMTSLERMLVYCQLPQEPPMIADGAPSPPPGWPRTGALEYKHVTAIYRPRLPPVLHDITFSLKAGQSCGVVGRTGSGKSSLMLTMFRLIPITHGTIMLDGLDTASIGLDALRKQLAIIPQDPVLFSGTVRSNLDPWDEHQDHELWEVLSAAKLQPAIKAAGGMTARMAEAGGNLSVGQRQLFCLARALLLRAKVLALDEATANVDRATDALIQLALKESAHAADEDGRVILVIAHRIDTIMESDHLLVLQAGRLVEQGSPSQLANQSEGGVFASMVAAANHKQTLGPPTVATAHE